MALDDEVRWTVKDRVGTRTDCDKTGTNDQSLEIKTKQRLRCPDGKCLMGRQASRVEG